MKKKLIKLAVIAAIPMVANTSFAFVTAAGTAATSQTAVGSLAQQASGSLATLSTLGVSSNVAVASILSSSLQAQVAQATQSSPVLSGAIQAYTSASNEILVKLNKVVESGDVKTATEFRDALDQIVIGLQAIAKIGQAGLPLAFKNGKIHFRSPRQIENLTPEEKASFLAAVNLVAGGKLIDANLNLPGSLSDAAEANGEKFIAGLVDANDTPVASALAAARLIATGNVTERMNEISTACTITARSAK